MMFKNSTKLCMANFSTVWKLLLYKLIVLGIMVGLFYLGYTAVASVASVQALFSSVGDFVLSFNITSGFHSIFTSIYELFVLLFEVIAELAVEHTWIFVYFTFLSLIVSPFLWKFSDIATGESLYGYMASLTRTSFVGALVRKSGHASLYSLMRLVIDVPLNLAIIAGFYGILQILTVGNGVVSSLLLPVIVFVYFTLTVGLKMALFSGWMPAMVVYNCGPIKGLVLGMRASFRRFFKVFSTSLMISAIVIAVNLLFGSFSFIITVPLSAMFVLVFQMVMFFGSQGMRYYVDLDTILTPKKLEETDKFKTVKDLL